MKHGAAIDWVLDYMAEHRRITGQARPEHPKKWVSALHRLTEERLGVTVDIVQFGGEYHAPYHEIAAAVLFLEDLGFLTVERSVGAKSYRGNYVEVVSLSDI